MSVTRTLAEAAARYGISRATLHRLLVSGRLPGAHKVRGLRTDEWRIPSGDLEALGYYPQEITQPVEVDGESLLAAIRQLTEALQQERREVQRLNGRYADLREKIGRLATELKQARDEIRRLKTTR